MKFLAGCTFMNSRLAHPARHRPQFTVRPHRQGSADQRVGFPQQPPQSRSSPLDTVIPGDTMSGVLNEARGLIR
jgi:hypothetical protein